jgi:hypothetical protein
MKKRAMPKERLSKKEIAGFCLALEKHAESIAADHAYTRGQAIRMMLNNPMPAVKDIGCTIDFVVGWCAGELRPVKP